MLLSFSNKVFEFEFSLSLSLSLSLLLFLSFFLSLKKIFCSGEQTRKVHAKLVDVLVYSSAIKTCATEEVKERRKRTLKKNLKKRKEKKEKKRKKKEKKIRQSWIQEKQCTPTFRRFDFFLDILCSTQTKERSRIAVTNIHTHP